MPLLFTEHSLNFDGSNDYISLGNISALSFERTDSYSLSAWVNINTSGDYTIFGKKQASAPLRGWIFYISSSRQLLFAATSTGTNDLSVESTNASLFNDNQWHHVCVTVDGSSLASGIFLYIDGALISKNIIRNNLTGTILNSVGVSLGSRNDSSTSLSFNGRLTEMAAYDTELTPSEVQAIYNAGNPPDLTLVGPVGSLIGYWRLGEHSYPTVPDLSPSGNNGTMTNMDAEDIVIDAPRPHEVFYSISNDHLDVKYVTMGDIAAFEFGVANSFSISTWVKFARTTTTSGYIVSKLAVGPTRGWGLYEENGDLLFLFQGSSGWARIRTTGGDYRTGNWRHVVLTYGGTSNAAGMNIYVDGVLQTNTTENDTLAGVTTNTAALNLMSRTNGFFGLHGGSQTETAIWTRQLSASDVLSVYNYGVPRDVRTLGWNSDLLGYWAPDPQSFLIVPDLASGLYDGTAVNLEASDVKFDAPGIDLDFTAISTTSCNWGGDQSIVGWVDLGTPSQLAFERTQPFSLSLWVRYTGGGTLIGNLTDDSTSRGWELYIDPPYGDFNFYLASDANVYDGYDGYDGYELYLYSNLRYDDNEWHHVCVVYLGDSDPATVTIYVDGVSVPFTVDTDNLTGTIVSAENVKLGKTASESLSYDGYMDDVSVWNKALSEVEVRTLYGIRRPSNLLETMPLSNLVGYWRMGDGDTFPTILDHGPFGIDGTMMGYLHTYRIVNERPPGAPLTQYSIGNNGRYDATSTLFDFGRNDPFSIVMTFRTDSNTTYFPTLASHQASIGYVVEISGNSSENDGGVRFRLIGPTGEIRAVTNDGYNDAEWYHLVITYDGSGSSSGISFYINGNVTPYTIFEDTLGAEDFGLSTPYRIYDAVIAGDGYIGNTCQHAVYDIELSQSNVDDIYGLGSLPDLASVGPTGNLVAYYPVLQNDLASLPNLPDYGPNDITMVSLSQYGSIIDDAPSTLIPESSLELNGTNEYISIGDVSALSFERTDPFTISIWAKMTSGVTTNMALVGKQESSGNFRGWALSVNSSNQLNFLLTSTGTNEIFVRATNPIVRDDTWRNYCVTYDGSSDANGVRIYEDGFQLEFTIVENTLTTTTITTSGAAIGASNSTGDIPFDGYLDNFAAYNKNLSPNEVFNLVGFKTPRDHGAYGPIDSLIGWWRLGESQGDKSPVNQNNGTLQNMDSSNISTDIPILDRYNKMRGLDSGNNYVTWVTQNISPDFVGDQAPVSVVDGTVVQVTNWSEEVKAYKMRGLQSGGPPVIWLSGGRPDWNAEIPNETIIPGTVVVLGIMPFNINIPRVGG